MCHSEGRTRRDRVKFNRALFIDGIYTGHLGQALETGRLFRDVSIGVL